MQNLVGICVFDDDGFPIWKCAILEDAEKTDLINLTLNIAALPECGKIFYPIQEMPVKCC